MRPALSPRSLGTVAALTVTALSLAACGGGAAAANAHRDPHTVQALLKIARRFNADFHRNRVGPVYDRWDARSKKIIAKADYVRRHRECPRPPGPATVLGAAPAGKWWLVHYAISGLNLTDYWRYQHGRWVFDLVRSNPDAVRLYRMPASKYIAAIGCKP